MADQNRTFTDADRRRVKYLLAQLQDEMDDSFELSAMFEPFGNVVNTLLTDPDITANLQDIVESERMETCRTCGCVFDANGDPHGVGDKAHAYDPYTEGELEVHAVRKSIEVGLT
jgi:hypothetical protein